MFMAVVFLGIGVMASLFSFREFGLDNITGYYTVLLGMISSGKQCAFALTHLSLSRKRNGRLSRPATST
jgi:hypothetical protein